MCSDNGASQEGGLDGSLNELAWFSGLNEPPVADALARMGDIGTDRSFTNYPHGWAMAGNTPFKRYKQNVHGGGSNDPLIISWPSEITDKGAIRTQFVDVIDITPTILDATGIAAPKVYQGIAQMPLHGASIAATFHDAQPRTRVRLNTSSCTAIALSGITVGKQSRSTVPKQALMMIAGSSIT